MFRRPAVWLTILCALVVSAGLIGSGYVLANRIANGRDVVERIQEERVRNTVASCRQTNRERGAIRGFIAATIPPERLDDPRVKAYLKLAERSFPTVNCDALVKQRVPSNTR